MNLWNAIILVIVALFFGLGALFYDIYQSFHGRDKVSKMRERYQQDKVDRSEHGV